MSRIVLVLVVMTVILSVFAVGSPAGVTNLIVENGEIVPDPGDTRVIDGNEYRKVTTKIYGLDGVKEIVSWVGSYSFDVACNTCTGSVTCYEKEDNYECRQSDAVMCTLRYCGDSQPMFVVPKE